MFVTLTGNIHVHPPGAHADDEGRRAKWIRHLGIPHTSTVESTSTALKKAPQGPTRVREFVENGRPRQQADLRARRGRLINLAPRKGHPRALWICRSPIKRLAADYVLATRARCGKDVHRILASLIERSPG